MEESSEDQPRANIVERWAAEPEVLASDVEVALRDGLDSKTHGWYRVAPERSPFLWIIYPTDQRFPAFDLANNASLKRRSANPEGFYYALEASIDCKLFLLYHSNGPLGKQLDAGLAKTASVITWQFVEFGRKLSRTEWSLSAMIERIILENEPNVNSLT